MKTSTITIILGVSSIVLFSILPNIQCLIMGDPLEYWDSADIILDGTVLERFNETNGLVQHDIKVEQYFKNPKSQTMITVYGPGIYTEDFFYPKIFEKGQRALFYLKKMDDKYIILEQSIQATEKCDPRSMIGLSTLPGEPLARGGLTLFYDPYQTCNGYLTPPGFLRDSLPPLKQRQAGIKLGDIGCHDNLQLMFRHNDAPVCVKESSVLRLLDYGLTKVEQGTLDLRIPLPTVTIAELPKQIDNETPLSFAIEVSDIKENHDRPTISITDENQQKVWSGQWLNPSNSGYLASSVDYVVQYYKEDFPEKIVLKPGNYLVSVSLGKQTVSKKLVVVPKLSEIAPEPTSDDEMNLSDAMQKLQEIYNLNSSFGPFNIRDAIVGYGIAGDVLVVDVLTEYYKSDHLDLIKQKIQDIVGNKVTIEFSPSEAIIPTNIESESDKLEMELTNNLCQNPMLFRNETGKFLICLHPDYIQNIVFELPSPKYKLEPCTSMHGCMYPYVWVPQIPTNLLSEEQKQQVIDKVLQLPQTKDWPAPPELNHFLIMSNSDKWTANVEFFIPGVKMPQHNKCEYYDSVDIDLETLEVLNGFRNFTNFETCM